jgi:hypothetical protein
MPEPSDIKAEEILRRMIRDRIGSTDPKDIRQAEDFRKFMDGLSAIQRGIDMLDETIRVAEDPGESEQLASEQIAQLRELMTRCTELKSAMEALIVDPWKDGYEHGWEDSAAEREREQVLATVVDLTARLRG